MVSIRQVTIKSRIRCLFSSVICLQGNPLEFKVWHTTAGVESHGADLKFSLFFLILWVDCLQSSQSIHTPNFLKVVFQVIDNDLWNQTARLYEIQVMVIISRATLVAVTSECRVKRVICKTWTGILANSAERAVWSGYVLFVLRIPGYGLNEIVLIPVQHHFPNLHSETIEPQVLSVLWLFCLWITEPIRAQLFKANDVVS